MSSSTRRPTPPPQTTTKPGNLPAAPLPPEQVRHLEINRLKAKALRARADAETAAAAAAAPSSSAHAGQKRPHSSISTTTTRAAARNHRDGTSATTGTAGKIAASIMTTPSDNAYMRPAKKFEKSSYIEYDLSAMTDTKGGFLSTTDDPHNKALNSGLNNSGNKDGEEQKPAHMTLAEWQRHQLLKKLRAAKAGPFEPGLSVLDDGGAERTCRECGSREIDFQWQAVFGVAVCGACKERRPERYSLLTKTEAREDYLLTDPELRDEELFPRLEKPNPRSATYHSMQLFLRCQLEEYAFSARKWGSAEALDAEFVRREADKKDRKEKKFKSKLEDLKKRTRVEAYKRSRQAGAAVGDGIGLDGTGAGRPAAQFGDKVSGRFDRHEHEWGRAVEDPETGLTKKRCIECAMEVEELEF